MTALDELTRLPYEGPILAIQQINDVLVCGSGCFLRFVSLSRQSVLGQIQCFEGSIIHSIANYGSVLVAASGRQVCVLHITYAPEGVTCESKTLVDIPGWILDIAIVNAGDELICGLANNTCVAVRRGLLSGWETQPPSKPLLQCLSYGMHLNTKEHHVGRVSAASGTAFGEVVIWSLTSSTVTRLEAHQGVVFRTIWSACGKYLLSVSDDRSVCLWDVERRAMLWRAFGHSARVWDASFDNNADPSTCASVSEDGTIRVWRLSDGKCLYVGDGNVGKNTWRVIAWAAPDSGEPLGFISSANDGSIMTWPKSLWCSAAGTVVLPPPASWPSHGFAVKAIRALPCGTGMLVAVASGQVWYSAVGKSQDEEAANDWILLHDTAVSAGGRVPICDLSVSPCGRFVAIMPDAGDTRIFEFTMRSMTLLCLIPGFHKARCVGICWKPSGCSAATCLPYDVISASSRGRAQWWAVKGDSDVAIFRVGDFIVNGVGKAVTAVGWAESRQALIVGHAKGGVCVFNAGHSVRLSKWFHAVAVGEINTTPLVPMVRAGAVLVGCFGGDWVTQITFLGDVGYIAGHGSHITVISIWNEPKPQTETSVEFDGALADARSHSTAAGSPSSAVAQLALAKRQKKRHIQRTFADSRDPEALGDAGTSACLQRRERRVVSSVPDSSELPFALEVALNTEGTPILRQGTAHLFLQRVRHIRLPLLTTVERFYWASDHDTDGSSMTFGVGGDLGFAATPQHGDMHAIGFAADELAVVALGSDATTAPDCNARTRGVLLSAVETGGWRRAHCGWLQPSNIRGMTFLHAPATKRGKPSSISAWGLHPDAEAASMAETMPALAHQLQLAASHHSRLITGLSILNTESGPALVSAAEDSTVLLWQRSSPDSGHSWRPVQRCWGHDKNIRCLTSVADIVVSGGGGDTLLVWQYQPDAAAGAYGRLDWLAGWSPSEMEQDHRIVSCAIAATEKGEYIVAAGSSNGALRVLLLFPNTSSLRLVCTTTQCARPILGISLVLMDCNTALITAARSDGTLACSTVNLNDFTVGVSQAWPAHRMGINDVLVVPASTPMEYLVLSCGDDEQLCAHELTLPMGGAELSLRKLDEAHAGGAGMQGLAMVSAHSDQLRFVAVGTDLRLTLWTLDPATRNLHLLNSSLCSTFDASCVTVHSASGEALITVGGQGIESYICS